MNIFINESNLRIHPTFFLESRQRTLEISVSHHSPSDVAMSRNLPAATLLNQKGFNLSSVEREYSKMIASQTSNVTTKQLECMASSEKSSQLESLSLYSVFFFCGLLLDRMESSTFRSPRRSQKQPGFQLRQSARANGLQQRRFACYRRFKERMAVME